MSRRVAATARIACMLLAACTLVGCVRGCPSSRPPIHLNPNMDYQEKYEPLEESAFFYDGSAMRMPVAGTVARGEFHEEPALVTGRDADGAFLAELPVAETEELLTRGRQRFEIFCQPCHDERGEGKGILTERGGVPIPSFHEERIRALAPGEIFGVITNGKGLMKPYRYPVPAADRWAIISHVRRLQNDRQAGEAER